MPTRHEVEIKRGKEVLIQASYNPIKVEMGRTFKVVKFAIDITAQ